MLKIQKNKYIRFPNKDFDPINPKPKIYVYEKANLFNDFLDAGGLYGLGTNTDFGNGH